MAAAWLHSPINPIIEDDVDSSVGGAVPRRPGMLPNRYNRSDEAPGELRNVASLVREGHDIKKHVYYVWSRLTTRLGHLLPGRHALAVHGEVNGK